MMQDNTKVPKAELNYTIDWEAWLNGDTVSSSTWVVPAGLTSTGQVIDVTNTKTTIKLKDGVVGQTYTVINRIVTTTSAEKDERSFQIQIVARKEE
jgi:hypothetical protein